MNTTIEKSLFKQLAEDLDKSILTTDSDYVTELKKEAFRKFESEGFPTVKNEDWKYTNVFRILNRSYDLEYDVENANIDSNIAQIANFDAYRLININGKYIDNPTDLIQEDGVTVLPIAEAHSQEGFVKNFAQHAPQDGSTFVSLNTALANSGLFLHVDKNVKLSKPIHLIHVAHGNEAVFGQTRNLIIGELGAEIEIVESFVAYENEGDKLFNNVTEISLAENAKMQHYYLQTSDPKVKYVSHTEIYQKRYSVYNNYNCNFPGASFVRHDINVRLDDENVESHLYGVALTNEDQLVDTHSIMDHMKPNCESYEWYKNITQDTSTAVFNGKIFVREDAQKTDAFQQNNNMLIGEKSAVYSKPQLEIFADDVKCSHGCTIGQMDDEALFYLRARGIGKEKANTMLVQAFAYDVTTRFEDENIRTYVEHLIEKGLGL